MHHSIALSLIVVFAAGCKGKQVGNTDETDLPACTIDDDCALDNEICDDEGECTFGDRDNSREDAVSITQDEPLSGVIGPAGDEDWYKYTSLAIDGKWLRIETVHEREDGGLNTVISVYDAEGDLHAVMDDFATGAVSCCDSLLHVYLPTSGDWYIKVEDASTFYGAAPVGGSTFTYELAVLDFNFATAETDSFETPGRDVDVDSGNSIWTVGVNLDEAGDEDFIGVNFAFDGPGLQIYGQRDIPGSEAQIVVDVLDETGETASHRENLGGDAVSVTFPTTNQNYVIKTYDRLSNGGMDYWYLLYFRTSDESSYAWGTELEPNNLFDEAEALESQPRTSSGGTAYEAAYAQGALTVEDDEDWFSFQGLDEHYVSAQCYGEEYGSMADLAIEIFDSSETVVGSGTTGDGGSTTPWANNIGPLSGDDTIRARIYSEDDAFWGLGAYYRCNFFITPFEVSDP